MLTNAYTLFQTHAGALPHLVRAMSSNVEGLRCASAQICRNIYVLGTFLAVVLRCVLKGNFLLGIKQRQEFKRCGGIPALVRLLEV